MKMKKLLSVFCVMSLLVCHVSTIFVHATELEEPCTEIVEEPSVGIIREHSLSVSNYNGSLCVNAKTKAPSVMQEIGFKDLTIQYSYDGNNWYTEWNAGDFLAYNTNWHSLSNYIMALDRSGCYYRIQCTHYAKKSFLHTQSVSNTSNAVWIG